MGRGYLLLQGFFVVLCTFFYLTVKWGDESRISNAFLRDKVYPSLRAATGRYQDLKFRIRGTRSPGAKITILAIDEESLSDKGIGRWPWQRVDIATIIEAVMQSGAKVLGFDAVFAAAEKPIPDELRQATANCGFGSIVDKYETDPVLAKTISKYKDKIVLGWLSEQTCRPHDMAEKDCPTKDASYNSAFTDSFKKFAIKDFKKASDFDSQTTPLLSMFGFTSNLDLFDKEALFSGSFNGHPDSDGVVRSTYPFIIGNGDAYPSLALASVLAGMGEEAEVELNQHDRLQSLKLKKSDLQIPANSRGELLYNFLGPSYSFRYVGIMNFIPPMKEDGTFDVKPDQLIKYGRNQEFTATREELFKDAYVLVGATALGLMDMRNFPFDAVTPGVEGHATAIENILTNKFMHTESRQVAGSIAVAMLLLGMLLIAIYQRLTAGPELLLAAGLLISLIIVDQWILFNHDYAWNLSFALFEIFALTVVSVGNKYISEEKQKQFLKSAMSKYVSPAVVNDILKDPTHFVLGGKKEELSILFSDIRGFTTFSEKLEAPVLAKLLNDYLGDMTSIICETHRGTLDKYIGDAIMAFWGAPLPVKDHGLQALQAAVDMQKRLMTLRPQIKEKYGVEVNVGMGINTGMVSVGNMGSSQNFAYTVLGDHVNTASRLEGLTKYYGAQILTSEFTIDQCKREGGNLPAHMIVDKVKVKGKETAIDLIQVFPESPGEEYLKMFIESQGLYFSKKFKEAKKGFEAIKSFVEKNQKQLQQVSPETAELFIERCDEFLNTPPPENWDGSYAMDKK